MRSPCVPAGRAAVRQALRSLAAGPRPGLGWRWRARGSTCAWSASAPPIRRPPTRRALLQASAGLVAAGLPLFVAVVALTLTAALACPAG